MDKRFFSRWLILVKQCVVAPAVALLLSAAWLNSASAYCNLDVDGSGGISASPDALLLLRHLMGHTGDALIQGSLGATSTRKTAAEIQSFLRGPLFDIDNDGRQSALTDGVIIARYMRGVRGAELTRDALGVGAQRVDPIAIVSYIESIDGCKAPPALNQTLPVEVLGLPGTIETVSLTLTAEQAQSAARLWLQTHNIRYPEKASVRINGGAWIALNNASTQMRGTSKAFGGIGGSLATLKLSVAVAPGTFLAGGNTIAFRFNQGNGLTIGYRVIAINVLNTAEQPIIPTSAFNYADPATWTGPSTAAADIAAGQTLWSSASLKSQSGPNASNLLARCADCHTKTGLDLKYFGYSNKSIVERAKFHGLTDAQGQQIASYIRSLPVKAVGRPWNPPYQPGPGTSAKPNDEWAAGAGMENVPDDDWDTIKHLFPGGIKRDAIMEGDGNFFKRFSSHDTPVAFQLPDWNHWLPEIHPYDAFGKTWFENTPNFRHYTKIRTQLAGKSPAEITQWYRDSGTGNGDTYQSTGYFAITAWSGYFPNQGRGTSVVDAIEAFLSNTLDGNGRITNPVDAQKIYSMALWKMVKHFELNEEFQLTGVGPATTNVEWAGFDSTQSLPRAWVGAQRVVFDVSPFLTSLAGGITGSASGNNAFNYDYLSNSWYQLQLILNAGQRSSGGHSTVDWGYAHGFLNSFDQMTNFSQAARHVVWALKGMDEGDNGREPNDQNGWSFKRATLNPLGLITNDLSQFSEFWLATPSDEAKKVLAVLAQVWLEKNASWLPIQMSRYAPYDAASATKSGNEDGGTFDRPEYVVGAAPSYDYRVRSAAEATSELMQRLIQYKTFPAALQNGYAAWTQAVWPGIDGNGVARNNWLQYSVQRVGAAPPPPSVAAGASSRSINVSWAPVLGASSYNIKRSDSPNGVYLTVAYYRSGNSYVDSAPLSGRTYYYRRSANTAQGESADSTIVSISR
jgi:cytochrome c553